MSGQCNHINDVISAHLMGEATLGETRRLRAHLEKCKECCEEYRSRDQLISALRRETAQSASGPPDARRRSHRTVLDGSLSTIGSTGFRSMEAIIGEKSAIPPARRKRHPRVLLVNMIALVVSLTIFSIVKCSPDPDPDSTFGRSAVASSRVQDDGSVVPLLTSERSDIPLLTLFRKAKRARIRLHDTISIVANPVATPNGRTLDILKDTWQTVEDAGVEKQIIWYLGKHVGCREDLPSLIMGAFDDPDRGIRTKAYNGLVSWDDPVRKLYDRFLLDLSLMMDDLEKERDIIGEILSSETLRRSDNEPEDVEYLTKIACTVVKESALRDSTALSALKLLHFFEHPEVPSFLIDLLSLTEGVKDGFLRFFSDNNWDLDDDTLEKLTRVLEDTLAATQNHLPALEALLHTRTREAVTKFLDFVDTELNAALRRGAVIYLFGEAPFLFAEHPMPPQVDDFLMRILANPVDAEKERVLMLLTDYGPRSARETLSDEVADAVGDPVAFIQASVRLARFDIRQKIATSAEDLSLDWSMISTAISSPDEETSAAALRALSDLSADLVLPELGTVVSSLFDRFADVLGGEGSESITRGSTRWMYEFLRFAKVLEDSELSLKVRDAMKRAKGSPSWLISCEAYVLSAKVGPAEPGFLEKLCAADRPYYYSRIKHIVPIPPRGSTFTLNRDQIAKLRDYLDDYASQPLISEEPSIVVVQHLLDELLRQEWSLGDELTERAYRILETDSSQEALRSAVLACLSRDGQRSDKNLLEARNRVSSQPSERKRELLQLIDAARETIKGNSISSGLDPHLRAALERVTRLQEIASKIQ